MKEIKYIQQKIEELDIESQLYYGIFSLGKVKNLYSLFIDEIVLNRLDLNDFLQGQKIIDEIFIILKEQRFELSKEIIEELIEQSYSLAISDDLHSSFQSTIATQIALLMSSVLEFVKHKKTNLISNYVVSNIVEIINIYTSEKFYTQNPDGDDKECETLVEKNIEEDFKKQLIVLESIQKGKFNLDFFIKKFSLI